MVRLKNSVLFSGVISVLMSGAAVAGNGEHGTKEEAMAMVKLAVTRIKADGADKVYADINAKAASFHDRDMYVVVYDDTGKCLAHGSNALLAGKDLSRIDYVAERIKLMKAGAPFWQNYDYINPATRNLEHKTTYCEVLGNTSVCVGVYQGLAEPHVARW